jgi:hypothetical protein
VQCLEGVVNGALTVTTFLDLGTTSELEAGIEALEETGDLTSLFRVSPAERGTSELDNGLHPANFPRTDELDGAAHFGNEARVNDFAATHPESHGVGFRIEVPSSWLSSPGIEIWEGMTENQLEFVIPRELFEELNQFPRFPWSPGR